jgi:hypothetical protein
MIAIKSQRWTSTWLATSAATAVHTTLDQRHGLQIYQKAVPRRQQTHLKTTCREIMSGWCLTWSAQAMPDHIHIEEEALFCGIARLVSAPPLGSCYFTILPRFNSSPESQLLVYYCRKMNSRCCDHLDVCPTYMYNNTTTLYITVGDAQHHIFFRSWIRCYCNEWNFGILLP